LDKIIIPNGVTHIGDYAYSDNNLTSIVIPDSIEYIGEGAFDKNNLTSIIIPENVEYIGEYAFDNDFVQLYEKNGRKGGTYTLIDNKWRLSANGHIECS